MYKEEKISKFTWVNNFINYGPYVLLFYLGTLLYRIVKSAITSESTFADYTFIVITVVTIIVVYEMVGSKFSRKVKFVSLSGSLLVCIGLAIFVLFY